MSCASPNSSYTSSNSSNASPKNQTVHLLQPTFHDGDPQLERICPSTTSLGSSQSSARNSSTQADGSAEDLTRYEPHLPKSTATKRDKLVGKVERVVSKIFHDPELHEQGMLRAAGGKELADGLTSVDPKTL
ncbi:hypothetical protein OPQ81_007353 [Rhizoctonia solani]|nr:hypothetical protein OPQ81_007353 [Rhizoctonia solani]